MTTTQKYNLRRQIAKQRADVRRDWMRSVDTHDPVPRERRTVPAKGPTSGAMKAEDPETRAMVEEFLARKRAEQGAQ